MTDGYRETDYGYKWVMMSTMMAIETAIGHEQDRGPGAFKFQRTKLLLPRSLLKIYYCGEPL